MLRKICPGCPFLKYRQAYAKSEWAKDNERGNCFLCIEGREEQGQPFECNSCLRWLPEESFYDNQRGLRSTHPGVCDKCLERRSCIHCKTMKLQQTFTQGEWEHTRKTQLLNREDVNHAWTEAITAFGNAMVATNDYLVIRFLINGYEEEAPTSNSQLHNAVHVKIKMNKRQPYMQRSTTSLVMKPQPQKPVELTTQTIAVNRSCPRCLRHKRIDMAKCFLARG